MGAILDKYNQLRRSKKYKQYREARRDIGIILKKSSKKGGELYRIDSAFTKGLVPTRKDKKRIKAYFW